jgi:hypothetical protein
MRAWVLRADAGLRLGPRAVALALAARGPWMRPLLALRLRGAAGRMARREPDLMAGPDVRPLWEAHRWADLPAVAPDELAPRVTAWLAAHPPFDGLLWRCGQEAAIRALHLALSAALHRQAPPAGAMALLARRIGANPAYAMAQDNNHPVSEAAGLLACGLALGEAAMAQRGARRLDRAILRLVDPDGGFAQPSPAYHRMLLDTVAVAEWLAARQGGPVLGAEARTRMAAATRWLHRLACLETGALPRFGHQDGSCLADLSRCGPDDARGSLERAARLFCAASAGWPKDAGCARLGLAAPAATFAVAEEWQGGGYSGLSGRGLRAILRTGLGHGGALRFRPNHADLLHLDVWDGALNLLRDGGTGSYNPAERWWLTHLQGTAAHNTAAFDGEDQMPRIGPFLFARWPRLSPLPDGAALRDHRGRCHAREVFALPDGLRVRDTLGGAFHRAVLRWRLAPGAWRLTGDGVALGRHRLVVRAAAPLTLRVVQGWESLAYGQVTACPVLETETRGATSVETNILCVRHA